MLEHPAVIDALEALRERGMSEEARNFASAALMALRDDELQGRAEGDKHVMLSYQWDAQSVIERLNNLLQSCGYLTWFDLTNMKGERPPLTSNPARVHTHVCEFGRTTQLTQCCLCVCLYMVWVAGSTMDAMSDAIEGAAVMLYGVSLAYKESANCRLEAS